jgi:HJR/Mrr/RecB family endonuclease
MASKYYKRHRTKADDQASFIAIVVIGSFLWVHKEATAKVEHWMIVTAAIVIAFIPFLVFVKLMRIHNTRQREDLFTVARIDSMTGLEFERYIANLLRMQGCKVRLTEHYDLGIDIIAEKDGRRWGIQVKRYSGYVGIEAVRAVVAALKMYHRDRAMVVTNSVFSRSAKALAQSNACVLVDRTILVRWID